jgi:hypothetical protein
MPWFIRFITDLSPWRPGFNSRPFCVRLVVDKLVPEQGFWLPLSLPHLQYPIIIIIFNLCTAPFKAYCGIWVRHSNFRHQVPPCVSPRDSTQLWKVERWTRNVRKFCLNADLHVTFRDLLHAGKLRHGIDGFTSPPKEGMLRIFSS